MKHVSFFGYREWALKILEGLLKHRNDKWRVIDNHKSDIALYYGWSWMIPPEIYKNKLCLALHPSPLPKYRGGSPLQHQIMDGKLVSAVTLFKITDKLDGGDIYSQTEFLLKGTLYDVFERIIDIGIEDTIKVLDAIAGGTARPKKQDDSKATVFKRRKPIESELTVDSFKNNPSKQMHNFIRSLADPYPNAFIKCKDGKKLYFTGSHL